MIVYVVQFSDYDEHHIVAICRSAIRAARVARWFNWLNRSNGKPDYRYDVAEWELR